MYIKKVVGKFLLLRLNSLALNHNMWPLLLLSCECQLNICGPRLATHSTRKFFPRSSYAQVSNFHENFHYYCFSLRKNIQSRRKKKQPIKCCENAAISDTLNLILIVLLTLEMCVCHYKSFMNHRRGRKENIQRHAYINRQRYEDVDKNSLF